MAPRTPPRTVVDAQPGWNTVAIHAPGHLDDMAPALVSDLKRPELIAAATLAYPGIRGDRWLRQPNSAIVAALTNADLPAGITDGPPPDTERAAKRAFSARRRAAREQAAPVPLPEPESAGDRGTATNGSTPTPATYRPDEETAVAMLLEVIRGGGKPDTSDRDQRLIDHLTTAAASLTAAANILRGEH